MKILIITDIRSGGTALCDYFQFAGLKVYRDPHDSNYEKIPNYDSRLMVVKYCYKVLNADVVKLSVGNLYFDEYAEILFYLKNKYKNSLKIIILLRNHYFRMASVLRAKAINEFIGVGGYKISYNISEKDKENIKPFNIDYQKVQKNASQCHKKFKKIKHLLDKNNLEYLLIRFEWLFDRSISENDKRNRILKIYKYCNVKYNRNTFNRINLGGNHSNVIYTKYVNNYDQIKQKINKLENEKSLGPFNINSNFEVYNKH